jgi:hypothetical protein
VAESDWKITKAGETCCACQARFAPTQTYFSALFQNADGFSRKDYCAGCFQDRRPEGIFYFWKAALPDPDAAPRARKPVVDVDYVIEFFRRLGDTAGQASSGTAAAGSASADQRAAFRYILALMLARKKALVFQERRKNAGGAEVQIFRERRGGQTHEVVEPSLSPEEIASVSAELGRLLGLPSPAPQPASSPAAAEASGQPSVTATGGATG